MLKKLILFPFGGNAREALMSVLALNAAKKQWNVLGFVDDDVTLAGRECCGVRVLGGTEALKSYSDSYILAVPGSPANYLKRKEIIDSLKLDISRFATILDPSVVTAPDAKIGHNTILMQNVVISCGVRVGNHCVVLPNTVISHDSVIGDCCCVGSNVSISGNVTIGRTSYIGSGTKIRDHISIGEKTLIGLGSNVVSDIDSMAVAYGNPAKTARKAKR